jgi:hypothetical protein
MPPKKGIGESLYLLGLGCNDRPPPLHFPETSQFAQGDGKCSPCKLLKINDRPEREFLRMLCFVVFRCVPHGAIGPDEHIVHRAITCLLRIDLQSWVRHYFFHCVIEYINDIAHCQDSDKRYNYFTTISGKPPNECIPAWMTGNTVERVIWTGRGGVSGPLAPAVGMRR